MYCTLKVMKNPMKGNHMFNTRIMHKKANMLYNITYIESGESKILKSIDEQKYKVRLSKGALEAALSLLVVATGAKIQECQ